MLDWVWNKSSWSSWLAAVDELPDERSRLVPDNYKSGCNCCDSEKVAVRRRNIILPAAVKYYSDSKSLALIYIFLLVFSLTVRLHLLLFFLFIFSENWRCIWPRHIKHYWLEIISLVSLICSTSWRPFRDELISNSSTYYYSSIKLPWIQSTT